MIHEHIGDLHVGDIVRHRATGAGYIITNDYDEYCIATRTVAIHNMKEWEVMRCVASPLTPTPETP